MLGFAIDFVVHCRQTDSACSLWYRTRIMTKINGLAIAAIRILQQHISHFGYTPRVHFELEGGYRRRHPDTPIDYTAINRELAAMGILGELKPEYWLNQWEYVSLFEGQTPLEEAHYLARSMDCLPHLLTCHGASEVVIRPVLWEGDQGRLQAGCANIFSLDKRPVHIPNAVQVNISVEKDGINQIPRNHFGERLQQQLIETSYECCLLYLPDEEGYQRLKLKDDFDLDAELSSPHELSGGHQGSIALYKDKGKHNQPLGLEPLVLDRDSQVIATSCDWHKLSRIEHRLGAASNDYNPYVNVAFALANVVVAIGNHEKGQPLTEAPLRNLPEYLFSQDDHCGAFELFASSRWFARSINNSVAAMSATDVPADLGDRLQQAIVDSYNRQLWIAP